MTDTAPDLEQTVEKMKEVLGSDSEQQEEEGVELQENTKQEQRKAALDDIFDNSEVETDVEQKETGDHKAFKMR